MSYPKTYAESLQFEREADLETARLAEAGCTCDSTDIRSAPQAFIRRLRMTALDCPLHGDGVTVMRLLGTQETAAAKRWLHHNVNQHRRELGLPVETDMEDLRNAARLIVKAYAELTKKTLTAFAPIVKALTKQPEKNDWKLGR